MSVTVPEVMKRMGLEADSHVAWSVGARVRDLYEKTFGELPPKELRPKTDKSGGTHCFAVYPDSWAPSIETLIRSHQTEAAKQGSLDV